MSSRRFAAYFFAIAAGSTFAFASTLRGQPAPQPTTQGEAAREVATQEASIQEASIRESLIKAGMTPTATDVGLDVLPPETARWLRQSRNRRHHAPAAGTMSPARVD